jgi:hypothetical protein
MQVNDNAETRLAIIDVYNRYAEGVDSKNWPLVRSCFADEVYIDYAAISDPTGSPDVARKAEDWLAQVQGVINGFDITRHIITNHRFRFADAAVTCTAYLLADHVIFADPAIEIISDEQVATVIGEYTNTCEFDGRDWKITRSKLVFNYSRGNPSLFEVATERAAALAAG